MARTARASTSCQPDRHRGHDPACGWYRHRPRGRFLEGDGERCHSHHRRRCRVHRAGRNVAGLPVVATRLALMSPATYGATRGCSDHAQATQTQETGQESEGLNGPAVQVVRSPRRFRGTGWGAVAF